MVKVTIDFFVPNAIMNLPSLHTNSQRPNVADRENLFSFYLIR